jgi:hypothetical protein
MDGAIALSIPFTVCGPYTVLLVTLIALIFLLHSLCRWCLFAGICRISGRGLGAVVKVIQHGATGLQRLLFWLWRMSDCVFLDTSLTATVCHFFIILTVVLVQNFLTA